jgi:glucokinase
MDLGNIAELNTFLLLDAIRTRGQATRRELGRELGLSDASVSRIAKRLLAAGLIEERPGEASVRGRTPSILHFAGSAGAVIAVDLGGTRCHGALADLAGVTLASDVRPLDPADAASTLLGCVAELRSAARDRALPVRAVVVGIPALIDPVSGLAMAGPNVHWQGFDLLAVLGQQLSEPFEVDNDVNLAALGEAWRGQGRGLQSFVTLSLGTGIGGAVVIDGHLIRGSHNAAGEVGYFPLWSPARPGLRGFEEVASGPALQARTAELRPGGDPAAVQLAEVFAAAARGDKLSGQLVAELAGHVAAAIVGVTALVDPERVILDGAIGRALEPWLAGLRETVAAHVFRAPEIVISGLGQDAAVTGAIARALALVAELDQPARPFGAIARQARKS